VAGLPGLNAWDGWPGWAIATWSEWSIAAGLNRLIVSSRGALPLVPALEWFVASGHVGFWSRRQKVVKANQNTYNLSSGHGGQEAQDSEDLSPIGFQTPVDKFTSAQTETICDSPRTHRSKPRCPADRCSAAEQFNQDQEHEQMSGACDPRLELQGW